MLNIVVLSSNKKGKCGIKDYTERVFDEEYYAENSVEILPIGLINCLKIPFNKADIVHLQHEFFLFDKLIGITGLLFVFYFGIVSFFTKKKLITTVHSIHNPNNLELALPHFAKFKILFPLLSFYLKVYYRTIILFSQKTVVLSKSSADVLYSLTSKPTQNKNKIVVLPHGVFPRLLENTNTNLLQEKFSVPVNSQIWTLFGFAFENKGYHLAIQALSKILEQNSASNIHLVIVSGEGQVMSADGNSGESYLSYLKRITKESNLEDRVHFTGFLGYDEPNQKALLAEIFTKTFAFLFPYFNRSNASGAMASILSYQKPVLVSDIQYFQEFPFLPTFKEGNVEDLIEKMLSFSSSNYAEELVEKVSKYVAENNLQQVFVQHINLYKEVLSPEHWNGVFSN